MTSVKVNDPSSPVVTLRAPPPPPRCAFWLVWRILCLLPVLASALCLTGCCLSALLCIRLSGLCRRLTRLVELPAESVLTTITLIARGHQRDGCLAHRLTGACTGHYSGNLASGRLCRGVCSLGSWSGRACRRCLLRTPKNSAEKKTLMKNSLFRLTSMDTTSRTIGLQQVFGRTC